MIRKLSIILSVYIVFSFTLALIQSCDGLTYKATICDISFTTQEAGYYNSYGPDTLPDEIVFIVTASPHQTCYRPWHSALNSNCYATTKCAKWQNEIIRSSFSLQFDKKLVISGDTILPYTDLFQVPAFVNSSIIEKKESDCKFIRYYIKWTNDLEARTIFEKGIYKAVFSCITNDNRSFEKERQVIFRL
jgi:hypothetical protein